MQPSRYSYLILSPSFSSVAVSLFAGVVLLSAANWSYVLHDILFYDYLFGPGGAVSSMLQPNGGNTLVHAVFNQSFLNNVIVIAGSLGVGIVCYLVLEGVRHLRYPMPPLPRREARQRAITRLVVAASWLVFMEISIKVVLPFCVLATQVGIKALWGFKGFLFLAFGLVVFMVCWHIHTVLLRLFLLRIRLFGDGLL